MAKSYFCVNFGESCDFEKRVSDSESQPEKCPKCGGGLVVITCEDRPAIPPPAEGNRQVQGTILNSSPYGGKTLMVDDNDSGKKYNGVEDKSIRSNFISELQDDLTLLGYYSRWRGGGQYQPGIFNIHVAGSVLALKYDLINYYGLPSSEEFSECGNNPLEKRKIYYTNRFDEKNFSVPRYLKSIRSFGDRYKKYDASINQLIKNIKKSWDNWYKKKKEVQSFKFSKDKVDSKRSMVKQLNDKLDVYFETLPDDSNASGTVNQNGDFFNQFANEFKDEIEIINKINTPPGDENLQSIIREINEYQEQVINKVIADKGSSTNKEVEGRLKNWDEWTKNITDCQKKNKELNTKIKTIVQRNPPPNIQTYLQNITDYSCVDQATALCIKEMLTNKKLNGKNVFIIPTRNSIDDPLISLSDTDKAKTLETMLFEIVKSINPSPPLQIINAIFTKESGKKIFSTDANINKNTIGRIVLFGVDWENIGIRRSIFSKFRTLSGPWIHSLGYGISQLSYSTGKYEEGTFRQGFPVTEGECPPPIKSLKSNIEFALKRSYVNQFSRKNSLKHPCSFSPTFECKKCLARLELSDFKYNNKACFELVKAKFDNIKKENEVDNKQYPCSWLFAIPYYNGVCNSGMLKNGGYFIKVLKILKT